MSLCCGSCCCNSVCSSYFGSCGSGSGPYQTCSGSADAGSVVNASGPVTVQAPSACGGNGSFLGVLQNTLTNGLSDAQLEGAGEYALGSLTTLLTGSTEGCAVPESAPTPHSSAHIVKSNNSKMLQYALIAAGIIGIIYFASKR